MAATRPVILSSAEIFTGAFFRPVLGLGLRGGGVHPPSERLPLATPALCRNYAAMTVTTPFADRFWTSPDGLALHARDYAAASGPARAPVICIHGLTRNARDFEALAPRLAAGLGESGGRRVLAVDVRGRGA